jgi:hypothetical protein
MGYMFYSGRKFEGMTSFPTTIANSAGNLCFYMIIPVRAIINMDAVGALKFLPLGYASEHFSANNAIAFHRLLQPLKYCI